MPNSVTDLLQLRKIAVLFRLTLQLTETNLLKYSLLKNQVSLKLPSLLKVLTKPLNLQMELENLSLFGKLQLIKILTRFLHQRLQLM